MGQLERDYLEAITNDKDFKEMMKTFSADFSGSRATVSEMEEWQYQGWLGPKLIEWSTAIIRACWAQIGGSHEKCLSLTEENKKLNYRLMDMQKRSLQEIAVLRDKFRRFTPAQERELLEVEYFDPLEYIEPSLRDLCKDIIRETVRKLFAIGPERAEDEILEEDGLQNKVDEVKRLTNRVMQLEGLLKQEIEAKDELRKKLVQAENVADEVLTRQREAGANSTKKMGKQAEELLDTQEQLLVLQERLQKCTPKSQVVQSPASMSFHAQVVLPGSDEKALQIAAALWRSDSVRYGPTRATEEEAEKDLQALMEAMVGKTRREAVLSLEESLSNMVADEDDPGSPKSQKSQIDGGRLEEALQPLKAELAEEVSRHRQTQADRDSVMVEREQLRGTLKQVESDKVQVEQALKALQDGMTNMSPLIESAEPLSPGVISSRHTSTGLGMSPKSPMSMHDDEDAMLQRLEAAEAELANKSEEVTQLRAECTRMEDVIKKLEQTLEMREKESTALKSRIASNEQSNVDVKEMEAANEELKRQQGLIEELQAKLIKGGNDQNKALHDAEAANKELTTQNKKLLLEIAELQEQFKLLKEQLKNAGISEDKFDALLESSSVKAAMTLRMQKKVFERLYDDALERAERQHKKIVEQLKMQVAEYKKHCFSVLPSSEANVLFPEDADVDPVSRYPPRRGSATAALIAPAAPSANLQPQMIQGSHQIYPAVHEGYNRPVIDEGRYEPKIPSVTVQHLGPSQSIASQQVQLQATEGINRSPKRRHSHHHDEIMVASSSIQMPPPSQNQVPPPAPLLHPLASTAPPPNALGVPSDGWSGTRRPLLASGGFNPSSDPLPRGLAPGLRLAPLADGHHEAMPERHEDNVDDSQTLNIVKFLTDLRVPEMAQTLPSSKSLRKRPRSASPPARAHQHHNARLAAAKSPPHIPGSTEPRRLGRQEPHTRSSPSLHLGVRSPSPSAMTAPVFQGATCRPPPLQQRSHMDELKSSRALSQVVVVPRVLGDSSEYYKGRAQVIRQVADTASPPVKEKQTAVRIAVPDLACSNYQGEQGKAGSMKERVCLPEKDNIGERWQGSNMPIAVAKSPTPGPERSSPSQWLPPKLKDVLH